MTVLSVLNDTDSIELEACDRIAENQLTVSMKSDVSRRFQQAFAGYFERSDFSLSQSKIVTVLEAISSSIPYQPPQDF